MNGNRIVKPPFFEIGPKVYLYGKEALELAIAADKASQKYDVDIIFTAQYTDIKTIKEATKRIRVFAQHMDPVTVGRGIGAVLPEAILDAGADGVLLNHAERPMTLYELDAAICRAKELGLATLVCAGNSREAAAVTCLNPDIVLAESPALIGKGKRSRDDMIEIQKINDSIYSINPDMLILHGAGISDENDVYEIVKAGADATGSTSGILKAGNPIEMMENMIASAAKAWKERT